MEKKVKVLIIDDQEAHLEGVQYILNQSIIFKFEITSKLYVDIQKGEEELFEMTKNNDYDLILIDTLLAKNESTSIGLWNLKSVKFIQKFQFERLNPKKTRVCFYTSEGTNYDQVEFREEFNCPIDVLKIRRHILRKNIETREYAQDSIAIKDRVNFLHCIEKILTELRNGCDENGE